MVVVDDVAVVDLRCRDRRCRLLVLRRRNGRGRLGLHGYGRLLTGRGEAALIECGGGRRGAFIRARGRRGGGEQRCGLGDLHRRITRLVLLQVLGVVRLQLHHLLLQLLLDRRLEGLLLRGWIERGRGRGRRRGGDDGGWQHLRLLGPGSDGRGGLRRRRYRRLCG